MSNIQPLITPSPSIEVLTANDLSSQTTINQTSSTLIATLPSTFQSTYSANTSLPSTTVAAMMSQASYNSSFLTDTEKIANGIVTSSGVNLSQLSQPGQCIKPGAGEFINELMQSSPDQPLQSLASSVLMTGQGGVTNAQSLLSNVESQVSSFSSSVQNASSALTESGILTGKESATQVAGVVMAAADKGVSALKDAISSGTSLSGDIMQNIKSGNFAASLADINLGGVKGLAESLKGLPSIQNTEELKASLLSTGQKAFKAVESSFTSFKADVPNVLDSAGIPKEYTSNFISSIQDQAVARDEVNAAQKVYNLASRQYAVQQTESNLSALRNAEDALAKAKQKVVKADLATKDANSSVAASIFDSVKTDLGSVSSDPSKVGIDALPGGVGALVNKVSGSAASILSATTAGGTSSLSGFADKVKNAISGSGLSDKLSSLESEIKTSLESSGLKDKIASQADQLKSKISAQISEISNAIGSIGKASGAIKVASIAENTNKKIAEVESTTLSTTLDSRVPISTVSKPGDTSNDKLFQKFAEIKDKDKKITEYRETVFTPAMEEYAKAKETLAADSPKLTELRKKYNDAYKTLISMMGELI